MVAPKSLHLIFTASTALLILLTLISYWRFPHMLIKSYWYTSDALDIARDFPKHFLPQLYGVKFLKEFLKKPCFVRSWEIFSEFLCQSSFKKIAWWLSLIILNKQQSFLYQRLCWRDSEKINRIFIWNYLLMCP